MRYSIENLCALAAGAYMGWSFRPPWTRHVLIFLVVSLWMGGAEALLALFESKDRRRADPRFPRKSVWLIVPGAILLGLGSYAPKILLAGLVVHVIHRFIVG